MVRFAILLFLLSTVGVFAEHSKQHSKHGYEKKYHGKPVKEEKIEIPKCPEGFIRKGGYCVRPEPVPKETACPPGSFDDGESCILTRDASVECESGTYVGDLFCEVSTYTGGSLVCPEGSRPEGDKCFVGGMIEYCPVGTARTPEGDCVEVVPREFFCPPGTKDTGSLCLIVEHAPTVPLCPDDTVLVDGTCIAVVIKEKVCPKGFADEGDECAIFEAPIREECPEGYTYNPEDFTCIDVKIVPSIPECPDGGELINGKCVKIIEGPTQPVCEMGKLVDGLCHVYGYVPADYICPDGYTLKESPKGPICEKTIRYDCSITKEECADEPVPHKEPKKHKPTHVYKKVTHKVPKWYKAPKAFPKLDKYAFKQPTPYRQLGTHDKGHYHGHDHPQKYGYCHKKHIYIPKTCEETLYAEPIPFCPEGEFDGRQCIVKDVFPPVEKCVGTETPSGECILKETYPPVYFCPDGFSPVGDGSKCEQVDILPAIIECPDNTVLFEGQCAIFVPKECPPGGCEETFTWPPEMVCPDDFTLVIAKKQEVYEYYQEMSYSKSYYGKGHHGKGHHGKGHGKGHSKGHTKKHYFEKAERKCVKKIYSPQESKCPEGFIPKDEETCFREVDIIIVDEEKFVKPQFLCPIGYYVSADGRCKSTTFHEALVTCPSGYIPIEDSALCIKDVDEILVCPKPSKEIEDQCFIDVSVRPYYIEKTVLKVPIKKEHTKTHTKTHVHHKKNYKLPPTFRGKKLY